MQITGSGGYVYGKVQGQTITVVCGEADHAYVTTNGVVSGMGPYVNSNKTTWESRLRIKGWNVSINYVTEPQETPFTIDNWEDITKIDISA